MDQPCPGLPGIPADLACVFQPQKRSISLLRLHPTAPSSVLYGGALASILCDTHTCVPTYTNTHTHVQVGDVLGDKLQFSLEKQRLDFTNSELMEKCKSH